MSSWSQKYTCWAPPTKPEVALDTELLRRAQAGDRAAFDELVSRYGRLVLSLARRVTGHRQEAEDVAQEAFLRLYRSLGRVDPERPLEPWLVRLTVNAARDQKARTRRLQEDDLPEEGIGVAADDPSREVENVHLRRALQRAVETLPEREREVFLLRDLQGIEVDVIAEALGISEVTVRRQSGEARRKVAAWFRAHHPEWLP